MYLQLFYRQKAIRYKNVKNKKHSSIMKKMGVRTGKEQETQQNAFGCNQGFFLKPGKHLPLSLFFVVPSQLLKLLLPKWNYCPLNPPAKRNARWYLLDCETGEHPLKTTKLPGWSGQKKKKKKERETPQFPDVKWGRREKGTERGEGRWLKVWNLRRIKIFSMGWNLDIFHSSLIFSLLHSFILIQSWNSISFRWM